MREKEPIFEPGQVVGQYQVVRRAGAGGMGDVYLAEDTRLNRRIAMKVLTPSEGQPVAARESLLEEARALAALSHPNIVNLFDVLEVDGRCIMVMEWVDGRPLTSIIGAVSSDQAAVIAQGIASALVAAHRAGIVHGDIKPSNVMLADDGRVRVLDFGICHRASAQVGLSGSYSGTTPYMAPEVLRGGEPTVQSDLFSLGVLLYELIAGRKPFAGDYEAAVEYAILNTNPPALESIRPDISPELSSVVTGLLAKDVAIRYKDAAALLAGLAQRPGQAGRRPSKKVMLWAGIAVLLVTAVAAALMLRRQSPVRVGSESGRVVAVIPFRNMAGSAEQQLADAMTDAVIAGLARDTQLSVLARSAVLSYGTSESAPEEVARELSADYVLSGRVEADEGKGQIGLRATLFDAGKGRQVWADHYTVSRANFLGLQGDLVGNVHRVFESHNGVALEVEVLTQNPEAYNLYLRGNDYFNRSWSLDDIQFAVKMYQQAIGVDSGFAAAWAMLARGHASMFWEYYDRSPERKALARLAADRAIALNPALAEAHLALGYYYYHCELDFGKALEQFYKAMSLSPKNAEVLNAVGAVERRQANLQMAAEHFVAALQLDPRSYLKAFDVGLTYGLMREYDSANQYLERAITLGPDWGLPYIYMAWLAILRDGDVTRASNILTMAPRGANLRRNQYYWWLQRIVRPDLNSILNELSGMDEMAAYYLCKSEISRLTGNSALERVYADSTRRYIEPILDTASNPARYYSYLGLAYAGLGQKRQALQYGQKAIDLLPTSRDAFDGLLLLVNMAEILVTVGEYDQAIGLLKNMLSGEWGLVSVPYLRVDPLWKPLRTHAAFQQLISNEAVSR